MRKITMRYTTIFIFCILCCHHLMAQQNTESYSNLTLQQCIDIAFKNNRDVQTTALNQQTAEANVLSAKGNILPNVNGNISHGENQGRSINPFTNSYINQTVGFANYSLTANVTVFNGFALQNNLKSSKLALQAGNLETQQAKDNLAINIIIAYLNILTNKDLLVQAQQQRDATQKQLERMQVLDSNGAVIPSQLYDLQGQLSSDEVNIINTQNTLDASIVTLTQLMNIPYSSNMQFAPVALTDLQSQKDITADSVYHAALANLAAIKATDTRLQSADYLIKATKAARYPSLYVSGGAFTNYSSVATSQKYINTTDAETGAYVVVDGNQLPVLAKQDNFETSKLTYGDQFKNNFNASVAVGISIPLLNGLQAKTRIKQAQIQMKQAQINDAATKNELQQNISQAMLNMQAAENTSTALEQQKDAYTKSYNVAATRLEAGVSNTVEYLIAKNNLDRCSSNLIIARYNYILRSMVLDYYRGVISFK